MQLCGLMGQMLGERILSEGIDLDRNTFSRVFIVLPFLVYVTIPLLGWLADAKLGNYRVFKFKLLLFTSRIDNHLHQYSLCSQDKLLLH